MSSLTQLIDQQTRHQQAVLCGYYGMGNAGDEALLVSLLQSLPPDIKPIVLSKNPTETHDRYGVEAVDRWDLGQVFRAMRRSQFFIWGGGSLMQDSSSAISPVYYGGLMALAQLLGLRTVAWAQGIGPLHRRTNRWLTRQVLKRAKLVTVRDRVSEALVKSWKIPVTLAPDPVWSMVAEPEVKLSVKLSRLPRPRIAVNLRSHESLTPTRLGVIQAALIELQKNTQATIVLLPFQKSLDWDLAQGLHRKIPGSQVIFIESPQILKSIFRQVDLTIAMRLHGVIMAASERCLCFALSYDPKVTRVMETLNLPGVDLKDDLSLDADRLVLEWDRLLNEGTPPNPTDLIQEADRHRDRLHSVL